MNRPRYLDYGWLAIGAMILALSVGQLLAGGIQTGFVLCVIAAAAVIGQSVYSLWRNRG